MKNALLDQVMNVLPEADSDGNIWASFYQFFNTKEKRTKVLESLVNSEEINVIRNNPEYFESALEYIFKKSRQENNKRIGFWELIASGVFNEVPNQETANILGLLCSRIMTDVKLFGCMLMIYPYLDYIDGFIHEFSYDHQNQVQ